MNYILAHDFGTSGDKALLFTTEGRAINSEFAGYSTYHCEGSHSEQDPEDWWNAFCQCNTGLLKGIDASKVLCVSFDGAFPNCLCVDKDLKPLHRCITWQDSRAYDEAREISKLLPQSYLSGKSNGIMEVNRTLPKLLWIKKNQPDIFKNTYKVFSCFTEYIILKLTGKAVCDYKTASITGMMNPEQTDWSDLVLSTAGIPRSIMPELRLRTDIIGDVPEKLSQTCGLAAGTKIVMGTGDSWSTNIGAGMLHTGDAYLNSGTSAGILMLGKGGKRMGGQTASSGSALTWLRDTICCPEQQIAKSSGRNCFDHIDESIMKSPVGSNGVLFHPYLAGELDPRRNPQAKGSFVGITLTTTREDLMRSVLEGIGLNLNLILQSILDQGYTLKRIPIVGGMGKSPVIRQIFADIMNIELVTYENIDKVAAMGAAVLGGIALGLYKDETAVEKFINITSLTVPNAENHQKYKKIMPLFEEVYEAQKPVYEHM